MSRGILGIDLGTSSVKALFIKGDKKIKIREAYEGAGLGAWTEAIRRAVSQLDTTEISAIGLSSQVGTYIVDYDRIIMWNEGGGEELLAEIKEGFKPQKFIDEISMPHPSLVSYPIPRMKYIKEEYGAFDKICMPKDYICELLTGELVTDIYSWRGLANLTEKRYSKFFLEWLGISEKQLPRLCMPTDLAGVTISNKLGIPEGIPVYIGCNDFFASLLGMGIYKRGQMFDITGTSEHIGMISEKLDPMCEMVNGPYFADNVSYGVTASSGASIDLCLNNFDTDFDAEEVLQKNPPIFLPYLNGERAPIWNADAKGMFFGISGGCTNKELAYSVMEGVVFSLWHIYGYLPRSDAESITVSGGGAKSPVLNRLKAELFGIPVRTLEENDTSALGAVMLAAVGCGMYKSLQNAADSLCRIKEVFCSDGSLREHMLERFETYRRLYPAVKDLF